MSKQISLLRQLGCRVYVGHQRVQRNRWIQVNEITKVLAPTILPKGGKTFVEITMPNGETFAGEAICSKSDCYNKKRGLAIALGRAIKHAAASLPEFNLE